jgi:hypothetical protein
MSLPLSTRASFRASRRCGRAVLVVSAAAVLLGGCTSSTLSTEKTGQPAAVAGVVSKPGTAGTGVEGPVQIIGVIIEQVRDENRGSLAGQSAPVDHYLAEQIARHIRSIEVPGRVFEPEIVADADSGAHDSITIKVLKAYVHNVMETKSAVVVLELRSGGRVARFRAQTTGLNWISSQAEYSAALRKALALALQDLSARLVSDVSHRE